MAFGKLPAVTSAAPVKVVTSAQAVPVWTVRLKVFAVEPPAPNALTVTVYVPAGCAFVTRTLPVDGSAVSVPLKLPAAETLTRVVFAGIASGVTVASPLRATDAPV